MKGVSYKVSVIPANGSFELLTNVRIDTLQDNHFTLNTGLDHLKADGFILTDVGSKLLILKEPVTGKFRKFSLNDQYWAWKLCKFLRHSINGG